jgi:hypothetical protein
MKMDHNALKRRSLVNVASKVAVVGKKQRMFPPVKLLSVSVLWCTSDLPQTESRLQWNMCYLETLSWPESRVITA